MVVIKYVLQWNVYSTCSLIKSNRTLVSITVMISDNKLDDITQINYHTNYQLVSLCRGLALTTVNYGTKDYSKITIIA